MSAITCPKCGTENHPEATNWWYCEKCTDRLPRPGQPVTPTVVPVFRAPAQQADSRNDAAAQSPKRKFRGEDVIGAALGAGVGGIVMSSSSVKLGLVGEYGVFLVAIVAFIYVCRGVRAAFRTA